MKFIDCPVLGRRPSTEFAIAGEMEPEPADLGDTVAATWTFQRHSVPKVRVEWWYHTPSQLWFRVTRDTGSDAVSDVELAGRTTGGGP